MLEFRRDWGRDYVAFYDESERVVTIPIAWIDLEGGGDPFVVLSGCRAYFRPVVKFLEGAAGPAPFGGKAIGEVPVVPVAAAIANALENAAGIRLTDLPFTPEKVWRVLKGKRR